MAEKQLENVINRIERYKEEIFSNPKLAVSLKKYIFLKTRFENGQIDGEFKSSFQNFYKLNGAGLTPRFVEHYFELLSKSDEKTSLYDILQKLYRIPNYKGKKTVQFSFATKLLHTVDNDKPIYDSKVAYVLKLGTAYSLKGDAKILWCENTYKDLQNKYTELLGNEKIKKVISETESFSEFDLKSVA